MRRMDQINVIPFIDIMLVLLAIVLTTATFIVEGRLEIRLPTATTAPKAQNLERIEIALSTDGELFMDAESLGRGETGLAALSSRLDTLPPDSPIVLRVDAESRFEQFVAVVDRLKTRGLERLSILTRRQ